MAKVERVKDAAEILRRRYVGDDPEKKIALETERVNAEVARLIYDLRTDAGLSQQELAEVVGTTQSVISRLEDADYEGHSLSMLNRIARALNQKLAVVMTRKDTGSENLRFSFQLLVRNLRKSKGLTVEQLAEKTGIEKGELLAMERAEAYRPTRLTLHRIAQFYAISTSRLAALAGAAKEIPEDIRQIASSFAAKSESLARLSKDEKEMLDEFVKFLRTDKQQIS